MSRAPVYVSQQDVIRELRAAGFPESAIPRMTQIAGGESTYNLNAHNPRGDDNSYGLFQINMLDRPGYKLGEERRAALGLKSNEQLYDLKTNVKAAKLIFDQQGLGAWGAHTDGNADKFDVRNAYAATPTETPAAPKQDVEPTVAQAPPLQPAKKDKTTPSPRQTVKDSYKKNLFRNLMSSVINDVMGSSQVEPTESASDVYLQAASKLYSSEDPYDQDLARKYERKAIEASQSELETPQRPAGVFAGLFGQ